VRAHPGRRRRARTLVPAAILFVTGLMPVATSSASAQAETCQSRPEGGPVFVTATCVDPDLAEPYTDKDERRSITDPATKVRVSYRYIHGGFTGTKARFSFYFPSRSEYRGLFFESTYPTVTKEDAEPSTIAFAISHGAYVVSTNNGGGVAEAPIIGGYRVNAASAKHSRVVAADVYATSERPRGYLYGASGGAYQTLGAMESTSGVWDGAVPMVPGTPNAIPSFMTAQLLGLRVLHDKFPQIVDAIEPGGSGDPYAGLDAEQQTVLREATLLGFPLRGWWQHATLSGGAFAAVAGGVRILDATYGDDFWAQPGYEGTDPALSVQAARIQHDATVVRLVGDPPKRVVLSSVPANGVTGADLVVTSGSAAGKSVPLGTATGKTARFGDDADPEVTKTIRRGDQVRIDNSWPLALQYYQRHQVPTPDQYGWNQFRDAQGVPIAPQRSSLVGPQLAGFAGGAIATGRFEGKMIMLASLMDVQAFPWSADWYRAQAQAALGGSLDDNFRLWYMDNADHDPRGPNATDAKGAAAHIVGYEGELQQALLDLDAWVTKGTPPPASSTYDVDANNQVQLPATADDRKGVQPVVTLTADGGERAEVEVGERVRFEATAEVPSGTGRLVAAEWDFAGVGDYPDQARIPRGESTLHLTATHTFSEPGTYFPVIRVTSQREGDRDTPYGRIQNLGRVRVVVQ
jgi:hypothetical protein